MAKRVRGAKVGRVHVAGEELFVVSLPPERRRHLEGLTTAEQEVLELLWEGHSTARIAALRGSSYRTVANQLATLYAKAGVTTREELIAGLAGSAALELAPSTTSSPSSTRARRRWPGRRRDGRR